MDELESLRLKLKSAYIRAIIISVIIGIISFLIIPQFSFFVIVLGIIIGFASTSKLKHEYTKKFKDYFVLRSLKEYFTDLHYNPDRGMPSSVIASTNMMYMGDRYTSNDYISGKYKDIAFEQADVHIEREETTTDSNGNTSTYYVTIFRGRWMIFDFNKKFKANVQITQKGFGNSKVKLHFGKKEELFKKVSMESESFNKRFKVYAQNEHDAFYIITPSLMQRIENLDEANKGKLLLCFIDNKLHIGLYDGKDSFEPGSVFKKIDEVEELTKIYSDIGKITQFVDELNLDNTLFIREV